MSRLERLARRVLASQFLRSAGILFTGAVVAQLIAFLAIPVLSRLYSPELFGHLGVFLAVTGVLGSVSTLRLDQAIIVARTDQQADTLARVALMFAIAMGIAASAGIVVALRLVPEAFAGIAEPVWITTVGLAILVTGSNMVLQELATRKAGFSAVSQSHVVRSACTVAVQLASCSLGAAGLVLGNLCGLVAAGLLLIFWHVSQERPAGAPGGATKSAVLRQYRTFALFDAPQGLINSFSQYVPILVLAGMGETAMAGAYVLTIRLFQRPAAMLREPVRRVFYQRASELHRTDAPAVQPVYRKATMLLFGLAAVPAAVMLLIGPQFVLFVLGETWTQASELVRWVVAWTAAAFLNVPAAVMVRVLGIQHVLLTYEIALMIVRTSALVVWSLEFGAVEGIAAYCIVSAIFNIVLIALMDRRVARSGHA